ncbi:MAG: hypothetical protein C0469_01130 [Cyanobacteria bacterium DS2.3.42]|nr:hypothetical protein [Cyanobacteria bacterium DS2.3.42]
MSVSIALTSSLIVTPDAVAKPPGKVQPVIILSQLQPFGTPLIPPLAVAKPKTLVPAGKKRASALSGKRKIAAPDHFRNGLALKAKGNSNRALIEFLKATQKNPRQINAFYEQALIFRQQGYLKLADSSLEQALRIAQSTSKSPKRKLFNVNDINRIRLLLATVRLEQGNVGSAAEELGRSLGIALTVTPANSDSTAEHSTKSPHAETNSPTTILQSLHPKIEEPSEQVASKQIPAAEQVLAQTSEKKDSAKETAAVDAPEKENAADATVSDLIKEGLAGLKDHLFNPLSILGVARIAPDGEKTGKNKKKEKRAKRVHWRAPKEKVETTKTAKADKAEKKEPAEKRKRRSWLEKRLALSTDTDVKPVDMSVPKESEESEKIESVKNEALKDEHTKVEPLKQEIATATSTEEASDVTSIKKSAALTFTKEETTIALADTKNTNSNEPNGVPVEPGSFSLTVPPALSKRISLVAALLSAFGQDKASIVEKKPAKPVDPIDEKLKYLAEHGTSSLREGEAFMFSEESGEATLFMSNGEVIRRTIAVARGHEEVAQLRRPDILIPEELIYNLALMAKILPKQEEPKDTVLETSEAAPKLKVPAILLNPDSKPHSFSDWLRDVLNL